MRILRSHTFSWWEIGMLKTCLISLGILVGVYFYEVLSPLLVLWWVLFIAFAAYFMAKYFKEEFSHKETHREGAL